MNSSAPSLRTSIFTASVAVALGLVIACGDDPVGRLQLGGGAGGAAGAGGATAGGGMTATSAGKSGSSTTGGSLSSTAGSSGTSAGDGGQAGGGMGGTGGSGGGGAGGGAGGTAAVCAAPVNGTGDGVLGEYFDGQGFNTLKVTRRDPNVSFNWHDASPEGSLPNDHFSVRWSGEVSPRYTGAYTFFLNTDDGARLTIDGQKVIDHFSDHGAQEYVGTPIMLMAGETYDLLLEYYENGVAAEAKLSWSSDCQFKEVVPTGQLYAPAATCEAPQVGTGKGLKGEYYDDTALTDLLVTHAREPVKFMWGDNEKPDAQVAVGTYSVRWTGQVQARATEPVTFYTLSDDGVRLFIDDQLVIDNWNDHGVVENAATLPLVAGQSYNVRLEYYQNGGSAQIKLQWASRCFAREDIPAEQLYTTYTGVMCTPPTPGAGTGLKGEYFNEPDFTDLKITHAAEGVDFDFGANAPDATVGADNFSIRWTGQVEADATAPTRFQVLSDDGARLWIDDALVVDNWADHALPDSGVVDLVQGQKYDVRLDYREDAGLAVAKLRWSSACEPVRPIPKSQLYPTGYSEPGGEGGAGGSGPGDTGGAGGAQ
jgi:hypothetical protein